MLTRRALCRPASTQITEERQSSNTRVWRGAGSPLDLTFIVVVGPRLPRVDDLAWVRRADPDTGDTCISMCNGKPGATDPLSAGITTLRYEYPDPTTGKIVSTPAEASLNQADPQYWNGGQIHHPTSYTAGIDGFHDGGSGTC